MLVNFFFQDCIPLVDQQLLYTCCPFLGEQKCGMLNVNLMFKLGLRALYSYLNLQQLFISACLNLDGLIAILTLESLPSPLLLRFMGTRSHKFGTTSQLIRTFIYTCMFICEVLIFFFFSFFFLFSVCFLLVVALKKIILIKWIVSQSI